MTKRNVIIEPDGTERELDQAPSWDTMRKIVGGPIDHVAVLRQDLPGIVFTSMYVHDSGLLLQLPRNQKATDIYLANVRRQFPNAENPSKAADEAFRKRFAGATVFSMNPPGWEEDPFIAGTVIWFDGWTAEDVEQARAS